MSAHQWLGPDMQNATEAYWSGLLTVRPLAMPWGYFPYAINISVTPANPNQCLVEASKRISNTWWPHIPYIYIYPSLKLYVVWSMWLFHAIFLSLEIKQFFYWKDIPFVWAFFHMLSYEKPLKYQLSPVWGNFSLTFSIDLFPWSYKQMQMSFSWSQAISKRIKLNSQRHPRCQRS